MSPDRQKICYAIFVVIPVIVHIAAMSGIGYISFWLARRNLLHPFVTGNSADLEGGANNTGLPYSEFETDEKLSGEDSNYYESDVAFTQGHVNFKLEIKFMSKDI
ncbi:hypothetical protein BGX26_011198, partial [Mortierella sp. AD094]